MANYKDFITKNSRLFYYFNKQCSEKFPDFSPYLYFNEGAILDQQVYQSIRIKMTDCKVKNTYKNF